MNKLETLCRPLIRSLCEYWYYARREASPDFQLVNRSLRDQLSAIRETVNDDVHLRREFRRIEQPLVFFVDYTIKEGGFPFSQEWQEIARDYNELSGDEKFFEQLSDNLDDPDASERLLMFYLFMGLGFDGCYFDNPEYIQRRMKVCATRFPAIQSPEPESLSSKDVGESPVCFRKKRSGLFSVYALLAVTFLCLLLAMGWNFWVFYTDTTNFRNALENAVRAAGKSFSSLTEDNQIRLPNGGAL